jgi:hypothetical protein
VIISVPRSCVNAGTSTSTDATTDAIALWLGLHGPAHQRALIPGFPWPPTIADNLITALARLTTV